MKLTVLAYALFAIPLLHSMQEQPYALVSFNDTSEYIFAYLPLADKQKVNSVCKKFSYLKPTYHPLYLHPHMVGSEEHLNAMLSSTQNMCVIGSIFKNHDPNNLLKYKLLFETIIQATPESLKRYTDIVKLHDFDYNTPCFHDYPFLGLTLLHIAVLKKSTAALQLILSQKNGDVYNLDKHGQSPLHAACREGFSESVEILLNHNPERVNIVDALTSTPLFCACENNHFDIVTKLVETYKANIHHITESNASLYYITSQKGNLQILKYLDALGIDRNILYRKKYTPLFAAASENRYEVVEYLLSLPNTNKEHACRKGATALYVAAEKGSTESLSLLCQAGANINVLSQTCTPLFTSCFNNHYSVAKILVTYPHLDINRMTVLGTALYISVQRQQANLVKLLLTHPHIDPAVLNQNGNTALHLAAHSGNLSIVKSLCNHSPHLITMRNHNENLPVDLTHNKKVIFFLSRKKFAQQL